MNRRQPENVAPSKRAAVRRTAVLLVQPIRRAVYRVFSLLDARRERHNEERVP